MRTLSFSMATLAALAAPASAQFCFVPYSTPNIGAAQGAGDDTLATNLPLGFDFTFPDGTVVNAVDVDSNGRILIPGSGSSRPNASVAQLLAGPSAICPYWDDLTFVGAGTDDLYFSTSPGEAWVTWKDVLRKGSTQPVTIQVRLTANDGIFFLYDTRVETGGLAGVSEGNGVADPGSSILTEPPLLPPGHTLYQDDVTTAIRGYAAIFVRLRQSYQMFSPCGTTRNYGSGCPINNDPRSAYEFFDGVNSRSDLTGTTVTYTPNGTQGYVVDTCSNNCFEPNTGAGALTLGDDALSGPITLPFIFQVPGGRFTRDIEIDSNGRVFLDLQNGNASDPTPTVGEFLLDNPSIAVAWADLAPQLGGTISFDTFTGPARAVVTYDAVPLVSDPTTTVSAQLQLFRDGSFTIGWSALPATSSPTLVGVTGGVGALTTGALDFTTDLPFDTGRFSRAPRLVASTKPVLGSNFDLSLIDTPIDSTMLFLLLGAQDNRDLGTLNIGLDGCTLLSGGQFQTLMTVPTSTQFSFSLPNDPVLLSFPAWIQGAAAARSANAGGIAFTQGVFASLGL